MKIFIDFEVGPCRQILNISKDVEQKSRVCPVSRNSQDGRAGVVGVGSGRVNPPQGFEIFEGFEDLWLRLYTP